MADAIAVSAPISRTDRTLTFETGKLAGQADGAVVARLGDTVVLVTATAAKTVREGIDFFPLTVDIEERMYAAGKIPGSFFRREGRATDQAILTGRLIDRPLRPSFPAGFRNEVHVVGTILGADQENPHDVLAINAASAALMVSGIPFDGPIGAVRVAWTQDGSWTPHATYQEGDESTFELVVAGRARGEESDADIAIMMVEAGGTENAWSYYESGAPRVTEEVIAAGLEAAKTWIRESIELQRRLVAEAGAKPPIPYEAQLDFADDVRDRVGEVGTESLTRATSIVGKAERNAALDEAAAQIGAALEDELGGREREVKAAVRALTKQLVRRRIVEDGVRIDGRGPRDIRPLSAEVGVIPTAHGSGLFQRGETQVLNVTTLGMPRMNQLLDTIGIDESKRYMHHYNFPPFSTGETGFMRGPKRREIGHGLLAERALLPVVPSVEEFPYTLRLVSEVLSSNGSTSMASVCGSTLSMLDGDQKQRSRHHTAFLEPDAADVVLADDARWLRDRWAANGVPAPAMEKHLSVLGNKEAMQAALAWYRARGAIRGPLGPIRVPTLYIWGDADDTVGRFAAEGTVDFIAAPYRFEVLPAVGHFAADQAPERVSELLLQQIAAHPV